MIKNVLLTLLLFTVLTSVTVSLAQQASVWECLPGESCEIPNRNIPRPQSHELSDSEKFTRKKEKVLAQEPKNFKAHGRKNERELSLDKNRRRHFSAWAFPLNNFN